MPEGGFGVNNLRAAITFSFFSVFTWVCPGILLVVLLTFKYIHTFECSFVTSGYTGDSEK